MPSNIKQQILKLLSKETYGLTIEDISSILDVNRATASKYLFALVSEQSIVVRSVGKSKLHYLKKYYGESE